ncbi:MAG TPA: hypothetical protein VHQ47_07525 [Phycisphaerae bacterium]|jgi:hypothetical protein|nr:hypothetical protein [Phycisphaerae bacterium]
MDDSTSLGWGQALSGICPAFLILRESGRLRVQVRGSDDQHFPEPDLSSRTERTALARRIADAFPDMAHGAGLLRLFQALHELSAGQPAAGTSVDAVRVSIRELAKSMTEPSTPKPKKRMKPKPSPEHAAARVASQEQRMQRSVALRRPEVVCG